MRYQENIYIQNQNSAVRNRSINNFNFSTDLCVFETPLYNISGATKLDCSGSTSGATYIITASTQTIPLLIDFTANTQTFLDTNANFRYEIYKYKTDGGIFSAIPVYKSEIYSYSAFSATNTTTEYIPSSGLTLDGEFIIKSYYQYDVCTTFLNLLGKKIDTINYKNGSEYNIYNNNSDFYFIAIEQPETPSIVYNGSNDLPAGVLIQSTILPEVNTTNILKPSDVLSSFVVTLNGLVLSSLSDYSISGQTIVLAEPTVEDDLITLIYTPQGGRSFTSDVIDINTTIVSGPTDGEGSELVYLNTTTNKYEVYLTTTPQQGGDIILMLNGATLANNIDYYQSTSNTKRLILEGNLFVGDILTLIYYPQTDVVNGLNSNNPIVSWRIENPPQQFNGYFSLEVSTGQTFNNYFYSGLTEYNTNTNYYSDTFIASGEVGTNLYYRVKNQKNYETICGNIVSAVTYSDVVKITILSNSINSY